MNRKPRFAAAWVGGMLAVALAAPARPAEFAGIWRIKGVVSLSGPGGSSVTAVKTVLFVDGYQLADRDQLAWAEGRAEGFRNEVLQGLPFGEYLQVGRFIRFRFDGALLDTYQALALARASGNPDPQALRAALTVGTSGKARLIGAAGLAGQVSTLLEFPGSGDFTTIALRFTGRRLPPVKPGRTDLELLHAAETAIPTVKTYLLQMRDYFDGLPR